VVKNISFYLVLFLSLTIKDIYGWKMIACTVSEILLIV
jgi:hypothetical protein